MKKIKKIKKIKLALILISIILSGCSSMNSKFDCPNKPGVNCRSLDQVNEMVDRGMLGKNVSRQAHPPRFDTIRAGISGAYSKNPFYALRSGEQVIRVWIAPYQDVQNNYHNQSTLYTVVHKSNWDVPKEVKE